MTRSEESMTRMTSLTDSSGHLCPTPFQIYAYEEKPTGIAGGSSYAAQGPILPAARLRACGLFTCILLLATRKRVFKIQC